MVHNKGGCKVGRREHGTKGGCKVGKRNPTKAEKEVAKSAAKKGKKLLKAPTKRLNEAKGVMKSKAEKKARIQQKVRDLGKAQIAKKKEKKKDFTAKPKPKPKKEKIIYPTKVHNIRGEQYAVHKGKIYKYDKYSGERGGQINIAGPDIKDKSVIDTIKNLSNPKAPAKAKAPAKPKPKPSAGQKLTGLTKAQMNAMSPAELFGRLPVGVAKGVVLNPKRTGVKVAQTSMGEFLGRQFREENEAYGKPSDAPIHGNTLDNAVFDLINEGRDSGRRPIGEGKFRDLPKISKKPERTLRELLGYYVSSDRKIKPSQLPKLLPKMNELAPKIVADMKDIFKYKSKKKGREAEAEMLAYLQGYKPNFKQFDFQVYQTEYIKKLKAKYPKAKFVIKSFEEDGMNFDGVYVNGKFAGHSGGSDTERAKTNKKIAEILK